MPPLREQSGTTGLWTWADALAAAPTSDDLWVITSPNVNYIPKPPIGIVEVILRSDCRYGIVDPIQYPQLYTEGWEYLCMIARPDPYRLNDRALSYTPTRDDFVLQQGSIIKCLGLLRPEVVQPLSDAVDQLQCAIADLPHVDPHLGWLDIAMHQLRDRLRRFPCTFRDVTMQLRETQRYCLMARAYLDFMKLDVPAIGVHPHPVQEGLMGAFSTDPAIVQRLFAAGVPVWYVRTDVSVLADDRVRAVVLLREPTEICTTIGEERGAVLYRGLVGAKHLAAMARGGHTYLDICRAPLLAVDEDGGYASPIGQKQHKRNARGEPSQTLGPVRNNGRRGDRADRGGGSAAPYSTPHPTQVRGINKFEPTVHEWMPEALSSWQKAMAAVDLSKPAKPLSKMWGYWIPEPGLLLRPSTTDRRDRYVVNWVRLRSAWLYILRMRQARVTKVPTQWWRDILYGATGQGEKDETKRTAQRWRQIEDVFGQAFDRVDFDPSPSGAPLWFGKAISTLNTATCRPIIWEVCELGFRHKLLALDRLLVTSRGTGRTEEHREVLLGEIFPDRGVFGVYALPNVDKDLGVTAGLGADLPHRRVGALEAFRRVLARWPRCPPSIHAAPAFGTHLKPAEILAREEELATFYVNTFFEHAGRAPIVPHRFPHV